ncbi:hypothetical protein [Persephonella sp.]
MKKKIGNLKRKAIIGSSLSLSALLFACGGTGDVASDSPYATVTGTVSSASSSAGTLSTTGIDIGKVKFQFIAAVAVDNGKLVYTADDIDSNGNFNLKLKEGLEYAFILFDISKKPKLIVKDSNGNTIKINGDGSVDIQLIDEDNDGIPDKASINISGSVNLNNNPSYEDNDKDNYPDNMETVNTGGTPNPDYDEDGDGYFDGVEDNDNDSYLDGHEDSNKNGIPDVYEDDDNDGLPNYLDDEDGDGYPDHIDDDDSDYYKYEMKGNVSNITKDTTNNKFYFTFTYNNKDYTVNVTKDTVCEINDVYYSGTDCIDHLNDGDYIELKTKDDINNATEITAVKFEKEDENYDDHDDKDSYKFEVYGIIDNVDPTNKSFEFTWNGTKFNVSISDTTKCEIEMNGYEKYYMGVDCLNNIQNNTCIELKTSDDIYNGNITDITAVEFETSDDCGVSGSSY